MATIPVTVTVTDKNGQTANSVGGSVTPASGASAPVNHGETNILSGSDNGNGNLILAQPVTLTTQGTLQSLSFYVKTVGGQLRLGLYNDAASRPGTKLAETAAFTPVLGWNTQVTTTQTVCAPGNYWLAYLPQSSMLGFPVIGSGVTSFYKSFTFAPMPTAFPTSPNSVVSHWSMYGTFLEASTSTVWVNSTQSGGTPPPITGWPDASTTGVQSGITLTNSGDITSNANGQVIEKFNVIGVININHSGVILRNCRMNNVFIRAANVTMEDCEIIGGSWNSGINALASSITILRCDISGVENGIWLEGNNCLIQDNYLHDPSGAADAHIDGLQIPAGSVRDNLIKHNNFNLNITNTSSCITMSNATNIDIDSNRLNGGSYTIYFEGSTTGCDVTNNLFLQHAFGFIDGTASGAQTYSGNVDGSGNPVSA